MAKINPDVWSGPLYWLMRLWYATLRVRVETPEMQALLYEKKESYILTIWHDELLPLPALMTKDGNFVCMVSASGDGEILSRFLERLGGRTVRGSSHRGGLRALLQAAHILKNEKANVCITVDGPAGPPHKIKDGVFFLAGKSGAKIMPVRLRMAPVIKLKTWDRFQIPLPFATVKVAAGMPREYVDDGTEDCMERLRRTIEADMESLGG
ncbi:MAG: lysophospholipid acyltransferase family protein [Mailhella sp.]|nr:lysophospholipid acyltransferase family protein [Mailhella sp.]